MKSPRSITIPSPEEAQSNLIEAVEEFVRKYRLFPYGSKINSLRTPLIQLKKSLHRKQPCTTESMT